MISFKTENHEGRMTINNPTSIISHSPRYKDSYIATLWKRFQEGPTYDAMMKPSSSTTKTQTTQQEYPVKKWNTNYMVFCVIYFTIHCEAQNYRLVSVAETCPLLWGPFLLFNKSQDSSVVSSWNKEIREPCLEAPRGPRSINSTFTTFYACDGVCNLFWKKTVSGISITKTVFFIWMIRPFNLPLHFNRSSEHTSQHLILKQSTVFFTLYACSLNTFCSKSRTRQRCQGFALLSTCSLNVVT